VEVEIPSTFGSRGEEVATAAPILGFGHVHEAEVGLMNQGGGLESLTGFSCAILSAASLRSSLQTKGNSCAAAWDSPFSMALRIRVTSAMARIVHHRHLQFTRFCNSRDSSARGPPVMVVAIHPYFIILSQVLFCILAMDRCCLALFCVVERERDYAASELPSIDSPVVPGALLRAHTSPESGLAFHSKPTGYAHRCPDWLGEDVDSVSCQPGPAFALGPGRRTTRPDLCGVRVSAAGPVERHSAQSARPNGRDYAIGHTGADRLSGDSLPGPHGRHARMGTAANGPPAAPHPGHDARIALPCSHR